MSSSPSTSPQKSRRPHWWGRPCWDAGARYVLKFKVGGKDDRNQDLFRQLGEYSMLAYHRVQSYDTPEEADAALSNIAQQDYYDYTIKNAKKMLQILGCDCVRVYGSFCVMKEPLQVLK